MLSNRSNRSEGDISKEAIKIIEVYDSKTRLILGYMELTEKAIAESDPS